MKNSWNAYSKLCKSIMTMLFVIGLLILTIGLTNCQKDDVNKDEIDDQITYDLSDMLGTWQRHSLVTNDLGRAFWIHGSLVYSEDSFSMNLVLPHGPWDTVFYQDNASISSEGVILSSNDVYAHALLSTDKTIAIGTTIRDGMYTLAFDQKVKPGTIYNSSDLAGTWYSHFLAGGTDVWTGWGYGISTIKNNGSYTIDDLTKSDGTSNAGTGTFNLSVDGIISVAELSTYHGFLSADKQLMVSNMTDGGGGAGMAIGQKAVPGASYNLSDLKGKWQMHDILMGSENWTEHGLLTLDDEGNAIISQVVKDNGGEFNYSDGAITFSLSTNGVLTTSEGDFHGFLSANKRYIVGTRSDDDGHAYCLIIVQKMVDN